MKLNQWITSWRSRDELVASFGRADLVRTAGGGYELRGGTPADWQCAKEWASMFLHEACFTLKSREARERRGAGGTRGAIDAIPTSAAAPELPKRPQAPHACGGSPR